MNPVDIVILVWLILAALRGYSIGLIRHALSFFGFILGLLIAGWTSPFFFTGLEEPSRFFAALGYMLVLAAILAGVGDGIAIRLQQTMQVRLAHIANSTLGVFTGIAFVLFSTWLIASAMVHLPLASLSLLIERSAIVQTIHKVAPASSGVSDRLGQLINSYSFPDVFVGSEPGLESGGTPSSADVEAAAARASGSTVRIEGFACGGITTGSGFVAAPNYIVTNAHVVAGVNEPIVWNQGFRLRSQVVMFDPDTDLAVLRTGGTLPGTPLEMIRDVQPGGTSVAALGYPGGGPLKVSPALILRSQIAVGRDIYNSSISARNIYALQVDIAPGNSGGPVVMPDGRVAGVIFGKAVTREGAGYAITSQSIAADVDAALLRTAPVSSGQCVG